MELWLAGAEPVVDVALQVADAWVEGLADQVEHGEQQVGGAIGVGGVPLDLEDRVVEDLIERVGRLAAGERDDLLPVDRVHVRHPAQQRHAAAAVAELARGGRAKRVGRAALESLGVAHGERAVPPVGGELELVLVGDDVGDRRPKRVLGQVPVRELRQLRVGER
jgi:hypothetical protein